MSWLSRFSLAQRALIGLMSIVAIVFGAIAIPQLKQQLLPNIELPMVSVIVPYQGASPDVVEKQVVEPLEKSLDAVDGLSTTTSTASEGNAVVMAQFDFGSGTKQLVADVQQAVNRARSQLPDDVDPQVVAGSTDDIPTVVLAATSPRDQQALSDQLDRTVVPELKEIDGVSQVTIDGVRDLQVTITPDTAKLARAGLSAAALGDALKTGGVTMPAGSFDEGGENRTVQVGTPFTSLRQIEDLRVVGQAGQGGAQGETPKPVRLGDVASVQQQEATATSITRTDGKPSLAVAVTMDKDGSAVGISNAVKDKLGDLRDSLGKGADLKVVVDQGPPVSKAISGLTTEGALGLGFAVVVILVFLASIRSTLVTAVSIPLSVLLTLIVLWTRDLSLNMLTLGALTIAIGRVVDDSIVVLENIKRHLGYGEERREAILTAVKEVAGAVTASTLTTVAVFLPIGLVGGIVGELFSSFSLTVTTALLASLLVSLTVVPVLSYWFLRGPKDITSPEAAEAARRAAEEKESQGRLQRAYLPVIGFATRRRVTSLLIAVFVLVVTLGMATQLKTNFFDDSGQDSLSATQELPPGTSLASTDAEAKKVEKLLDGVDGVSDVQVTVGSSGFMAAFGGSTDSNHASYQIKLRSEDDADKVQDALESGFKKLDGAGELKVSAGGGFGDQDLSVVVKAPDRDSLAKAAQQVTDAVKKIDDVKSVENDLATSVPRVSVTAKPAAADAGLSQAALGALVAEQVNGTRTTTATLDDTERDVVVRSAHPATTVAELKALPVGGAKLGDLATVRLVDGPVSMTRIDGARAATVTAKPVGDDTGSISTELTKKLDELKLPQGATTEIGGVTADQNDSLGKLALAMLAAVAIVFLLLVGTFRSLIQPLILLVSIPFAATGALGLLLVTGTPLGVPAMIGMLMLIGIVVTNAIVLIDLINQYRDRGYGVIEAVTEGGRHRLRPILMTALATIFALIPMATGITGEGGFISQPLAVVVIGGLITSTLLTLLLVPTLYAMVELRKERRAAKKAKKKGEDGTEVPTPREPVNV
ncbi:MULTISPECIES: efflux RND transporter permease subunit [Streptomyces]|uniref:Efflux RND transporter permease subunit n=1 Tax=Streptomyces evansiae TaxID=3075535 RepID=A0ABU2RA05_9ACTN|nr:MULTISPECIES: efflux RND transporter permease subunit [unclassified Streptomyces]MDT0413533.1 efflux RND transporter permease subunit [Streptomyces sp. DSM 41979]MYQ55959.1 MMPL family transporter [Streptomyces sp. SID4926]SCD79303.1 hydrophobic/amphiphilic exporter-1, HAE1 family [Streptomyces sp. DfronAA-171]